MIIGGGYIGLEMAEALRSRGMAVTVVEQAPEVMNSLDPDMGALVSEALEKAGVTLYRNESLEAFVVGDGRMQAVATDHREIPADIAILGIGVQPNTVLAEEAGLTLGAKESIKVDNRMQTDVEGVWAGGDCAESFHLVSRQPVHIALGTVANKHGRVAGINIGGGHAMFPGVMGTAITKICDVGVARTGLQEEDIQQLGIDCVTEAIESSNLTGYYPDAGRISVKLLAEKTTGRLLGGQMVGDVAAVKRIDTVATALHDGFSLDQMLHLDLSYAPPFSPVWDPVLVAVRKLIRQI